MTNTPNSNNAIPTPNRPFAKFSQLILAIERTAPAITLSAALNTSNATAVLNIPLLSLFISLLDTTNIANILPTLSKPLAIPSHSKPAIFFIAADNTNTAADKINSDVANLTKPLSLLPSVTFNKAAVAATISMIKIVTAINAGPNLSGLIVDNTANEAANIPTAAAIFNNVEALRLF